MDGHPYRNQRVFDGARPDEFELSLAQRRARVATRRIVDTGPWVLSGVLVCGVLSRIGGPWWVVATCAVMITLCALVAWGDPLSSASYERASSDVRVARKGAGAVEAQALALRWLRWAFARPWRWSDRERSELLEQYAELCVLSGDLHRVPVPRARHELMLPASTMTSRGSGVRGCAIDRIERCPALLRALQERAQRISNSSR